MNVTDENPPNREFPPTVSFLDDFKRFFIRGLAAVLPTLITLSLVAWVWNELHRHLGGLSPSAPLLDQMELGHKRD